MSAEAEKSQLHTCHVHCCSAHQWKARGTGLCPAQACLRPSHLPLSFLYSEATSVLTVPSTGLAHSRPSLGQTLSTFSDELAHTNRTFFY